MSYVLVDVALGEIICVVGEYFSHLKTPVAPIAVTSECDVDEIYPIVPCTSGNPAATLSVLDTHKYF